MKVMTIGAALVDLYVQSNEFKIERSNGGVYLCQAYGSKLEMDKLTVAIGGGASNVACGLARQGFEVTMISEIGHDVWGTMVLSEMQKEGVHLDWVVRERLEETGKSVILLGSDGGRTVIVDRGASALLDGYDIPSARIADMDWVHFTSVNGAKTAINKVLQTMQIVKKTGFSWNPGSVELKLIAAGEIELPKKFKQESFFLVNKEEWQTIEKRQNEINELFDLVIVTDGRNGGKVYKRGQVELEYEAAKIDGQIVDETGAGDAFATGMIVGILEKKSLRETCAWAGKNSASVVQAIGAKTGLLKKAGI